jgi:AcrR family transcriptional regulator
MQPIFDVRNALLEALRRQVGDHLADRVEAEIAAHPDGTFEDLDDLVFAWEYVARDQWLDEECEIVSEEPCPSCAARNGEIYETWKKAIKVLPNGGPNPECTAANCFCSIGPAPER